MNYKFKGTPAPWYPVDFDGYWEILNGTCYTDMDVFDEELCNKAALNAKLASKSPEMFDLLVEILETTTDKYRYDKIEQLLKAII